MQGVQTRFLKLISFYFELCIVHKMLQETRAKRCLARVSIVKLGKLAQWNGEKLLFELPLKTYVLLGVF